MEYAGVKLRALLLARGLREIDLVDGKVHGKFVNLLVHGKGPADEDRLARLAARLRVPAKFLSDDSLWPADGQRFGLSERDANTVEWLRSLYAWYIAHAGAEAAHKFLGLDFDVLRRQSQILQALARSFGDEAVIRVFVGSDYEEGRFDREFATIERLSERRRTARRGVLEYVQDIPAAERLPGRAFPSLALGDLELEISFAASLPGDRADIRYSACTDGIRRLVVRQRMDDFRLAFILAREYAIHLAAQHGLIPGDAYVAHHWPCASDTYQRSKAEALINRFAAAILLPRSVITAKAREILLRFSDETVERACVELAVAPETLLLRIVQILPRQAHFIRIDTPGPDGPYSLEKLFRGNGLPLQHRYKGLLPDTWGVMKSLAKFFATDPARASAASRHVQVTNTPRCGDETWLCMSLTYPRFGGGAKALCIGFRLGEFRKLYRSLPVLSEKRATVDAVSDDVDWTTLMSLEKAARQRRS